MFRFGTCTRPGKPQSPWNGLYDDCLVQLASRQQKIAAKGLQPLPADHVFWLAIRWPLGLGVEAMCPVPGCPNTAAHMDMFDTRKDHYYTDWEHINAWVLCTHHNTQPMPPWPLISPPHSGRQ